MAWQGKDEQVAAQRCISGYQSGMEGSASRPSLALPFSFLSFSFVTTEPSEFDLLSSLVVPSAPTVLARVWEWMVWV